MSLAILVAGALLWPQVGDARDALGAVGDVNPLLLALGALLQACAVVCQAMLTRAVLPDPGDVSAPDMVRIELAAMAGSHTLPGGTAAGTALSFSQLRRAGVAAPDVGFAVGVRGLGSALVLNVILWAALVATLPLRQPDLVYALVAGAGALLLGAVVVIALLLLRWPEGTAERLAALAARLPVGNKEKVKDAVRQAGGHLRALGRDPRLLAVSTAWSAGYWLLGAASLWVFIDAFGARVGVAELLVAYGAGNVVAFLPLTPRGLGTLELTVVSLLSGFGVPSGPALLGVLSWRLVSFWAPIPVGLVSYIWLTAHAPGSGDAKARADGLE